MNRSLLFSLLSGTIILASSTASAWERERVRIWEPRPPRHYEHRPHHHHHHVPVYEPFRRPRWETSWNEGQWQHGWYEGEHGWWWVAGGRWHRYSSPRWTVPPISIEFQID